MKKEEKGRGGEGREGMLNISWVLGVRQEQGTNPGFVPCS